MIVFILSVGVFLMVGLLISAVILNTQSEKKKRALNIIQRGASAEHKQNTEQQERNVRRSNFEKKLRDSQNKEKSKKAVSLNDQIMQAGLNISVQAFWIRSIIFSIIVTALVFFVKKSLFLSVMALVISLLGIPKLFLRIKTNNRQKLFLEDFADALEAMMRLLKAGMPVSEAIRMVANEFEGPIGCLLYTSPSPRDA